MLEILWGTLNIAVLVYFTIICFKIHKNLGVLAALVFVFGLLSFISKPKEDNSKSKTFNSQNEITKIELNKFSKNTYSREKTLEDKLSTDIKILISFGENASEKKLLYANVYRNGFVSGTDWETTNIYLSKLGNDNYQYNVIGKVDWKVLGIKLYTQIKEFEGKIELKKINRYKL